MSFGIILCCLLASMTIHIRHKVQQTGRQEMHSQQAEQRSYMAGHGATTQHGDTHHIECHIKNPTHTQSTGTYLALVMVVLMCLAPEASAVMKGRLMSV